MRNGMTLEFKVTQQTITRLDSNVVYENSNNYLFAHFIFSDDWKGATKVVKFRDAFTDAYVDVTLGKDNKCTIPSITTLYPVTFLTIVGTKENQTITTNDIAIDVFKSGEHYDVPHPITHDGNQLKTYANEDIFPNTLIEITYEELATLKEEHKLVLGAKYRITDYVTKVNGTINNVQNLARSMEHPFDIVVTAISTDKLSETARALLHEGDTYFTNCDLSAWKLEYCFDNDIDRFEWADTENGKGVIYHMIDEFGNDLPYDFKSIQFKRYKITGTTDSRQTAFIGKYYAFNGSYGLTYDSTDYMWYYTCNDIDRNDLSIQNTVDHSYGNCRYVKQLKVGQYLSDEPNYRGKQALNDIVLISPSMIVDLQFGVGSTKNTLIGNEDMTYSYFGEMCRRNIICGELSHNRCEECFQENLIGTGISTDETFHFVRTARHFENNIIIKMISAVFEDIVVRNKFPNEISYSFFASAVSGNDFSNMALLSHCKALNLYYTKIYGSGAWMYNTIIGIYNCEIHIDSLRGSTVSYLQNINFTKNNEDTISIINMNFDTILGASTITTINLSDLSSYGLGEYAFKKLSVVKTNQGEGKKYEFTCEYVEDGKKSFIGAYSEDNGVTWLPLAQATGGSTNYVVTELPTQDIDTNGNYFVMTESEDARGYLSTDISNLTTTEYPPTNPGTQRNTATVNSVDYVQLNTATVSTGDYMGDLAIKFNVPCDVTVTVNPRQTRLAFMYIDVNGTNVKLVSAGETESYTRTFNKDETLCVRGASFSTNDFYYKLAIQPHAIDGKIPLSTNVDEYINFENLWFKNGGSSGGGKLYLHRITLSYSSSNYHASFEILSKKDSAYTYAEILAWLTSLGTGAGWQGGIPVGTTNINATYFPTGISYNSDGFISVFYWNGSKIVRENLVNTGMTIYDNYIEV